MRKSAGRESSLRLFTLAFALQLRKKHGKTTVRVREASVRLIKTSVRVQYTYYQDTHTLQNPHTHTHTHTHTHHTYTHITKHFYYYFIITLVITFPSNNVYRTLLPKFL
jgi:hypothetical protein